MGSTQVSPGWEGCASSALSLPTIKIVLGAMHESNPRLFSTRNSLRLMSNCFEKPIGDPIALSRHLVDADRITSGVLYQVSCASPLPLDPALKVLNLMYRGGADCAYGYWQMLSDLDRHAFAKAKVEGGTTSMSMYGEVTPLSAGKMLRELGAMPGLRFYDVGSGGGKLVLLALLLGLRATGIELSSCRHRFACRALDRLRKMVPAADTLHLRADLIHGNFLEASIIDFSKADIVFVNDVGFDNALMFELSNALRSLRSGARVATFRRLIGPGFKCVSIVAVNVSWLRRGLNCLVYQRIEPSVEDEEVGIEASSDPGSESDSDGNDDA